MNNIFFYIPLTLILFLGLTSCVQVPKTVQYDTSLSFTKIDGYKFHTEIWGDPKAEPIIVVHGGPGADYTYLKSLQSLSEHYRVIFYDQRGSGLSPRVDEKYLTLETSLDDLDAIVNHFSPTQKVKLIGHSWGGMLVTAYLSAHPKRVSQAVIIEPGMLHQDASRAFVSKMKESQSILDLLAMIKYFMVYPFVDNEDGHEKLDYVMTKILNKNKPGAPYQCEEQSMPENIFRRGGFASFNSMLKPIIDNPNSFTYDLTKGISKYSGDLLLLSSECSIVGYEFQNKYHLPKLPLHSIHIEAKNMGHNMLTLNPKWSLGILNDFFKQQR